MKARELHEMTNEELSSKLGALKTELFNLRFRHATGQMENPMAMVTCKKDIARILTIQRERALGIEKKAKKA